jgi:hypothetical protein
MQIGKCQKVFGYHEFACLNTAAIEGIKLCCTLYYHTFIPANSPNFAHSIGVQEPPELDALCLSSPCSIHGIQNIK